ncbi:MAG: hypothetical protein IKU23_08425 [Clostridia bacterium]|nr:hypothetical protein [Clostridia bacterium]
MNGIKKTLALIFALTVLLCACATETQQSDRHEQDESSKQTDNSVSYEPSESSAAQESSEDASEDVSKESSVPEISEDTSSSENLDIIDREFNAELVDYIENIGREALAQSYFTDRAGADVMLEGYVTKNIGMDTLIPDPAVNASIFEITNELGEKYDCYALTVTWSTPNLPELGAMLPFKTTNKNLKILCRKLNIPENDLSQLCFTYDEILELDLECAQALKSLIVSAKLVLRLDS